MNRKDLIILGRVSTVYPDRLTARVMREDNDLLTGELSILVNGSDEWIPNIGDYVVCLFLPNGTSGFILGTFQGEE
ncbi:hypothetical protein [Mesobacillus thioparans]|uniref:hypothetical protein n=1 Tax=Mesobacillus thioparans TaxID=370439 RepID=UPI0039EEEB81